MASKGGSARGAKRPAAVRPTKQGGTAPKQYLPGASLSDFGISMPGFTVPRKHGR